MKVCEYKGLVIAVLTRNEHCPPHVHVGTDKWEARFEFSFWHNGVLLWDVVPVKNRPKAELLEGVRQALKQPVHLQRAREIWWNSTQSVCLVNQLWDMDEEEVVSTKGGRRNTCRIDAAQFNVAENKTILQLAGQSSPLEIEL